MIQNKQVATFLLFLGWTWPAAAVPGTPVLTPGCCCWLPAATDAPSLAEDAFLFLAALESQDAAEEASSAPP